MEMFGLAMIVILIIVGFFIFVSFRQKNPVNTYKNDFISDEMPSNFINSIVNVNPRDCISNDYTLSDMLKFCAKGDIVECNGLDACVIANSTMNEIANKTLNVRGLSYNLYTKGLGSNEININNLDCTKNKPQGQTGTLPISLYPVPGQIYIYLEICK